MFFLIYRVFSNFLIWPNFVTQLLLSRMRRVLVCQSITIRSWGGGGGGGVGANEKDYQPNSCREFIM